MFDCDEKTGLAEFCRSFALEAEVRSALVIDIRGNAGGHVSGLVLARLMQRVVESARTGSAANDALGHAARRDMLEHWSPRAVAGTILARARAIMLRVEE